MTKLELKYSNLLKNSFEVLSVTPINFRPHPFGIDYDTLVTIANDVTDLELKEAIKKHNCSCKNFVNEDYTAYSEEPSDECPNKCTLDIDAHEYDLVLFLRKPDSFSLDDEKELTKKIQKDTAEDKISAIVFVEK